MISSFSVSDSLALADLRVYLSRAGRVEDASVRLVAGSGVLAVYSAMLYPRGLLDATPTVLGLRTFATDRSIAFDAVVPSRSILDRVARLEKTVDAEAANIGIQLPARVDTVSWAGISPPRTGWLVVGSVESRLLAAVARSGIDEVATAIPAGTGEQLVQRVRSEVWGRPVGELEYLPAGAAFAALTLGFLGEDAEQATLYRAGSWTRLTLSRGHVLVRRPAGGSPA